MAKPIGNGGANARASRSAIVELLSFSGIIYRLRDAAQVFRRLPEMAWTDDAVVIAFDRIVIGEKSIRS